MEIRKLQAQEWDQTAALVWQVFQEFEAPVYPPEGVESFAAFLRDRQDLLTLDGWASWDGPTLTGVLAARPGGGHICLLFVRADRHRQGVGRALWHTLLTETAQPVVTVHASPYAVGFYHRLGFRDKGEEQMQDGIRFTPMEYRR